MSEGRRYMLALVQQPDGAFTPVSGRIEVRGGKVERIEIPELQRTLWLDLLIAARVEIEAQCGVPAVKITEGSQDA